jgi:hypothetical protein
MYRATLAARSYWSRSFVTHSSPIEVESYIDKHSYVAKLRKDKALQERRHVNVASEESKLNHLSHATLLGVGRVTVPPFCWTEEGKRLFAVMHIGDKAAGHKGIVHGGLLAV